MNETLYKMLEPTKTIEQSLPKIIEAFVTFYGEENRAYIEEKFNNLIIVGYGLPDKLFSIIHQIKENENKKLIEYFFDKVGINENRQEFKNIFFSTSGFDYLNLIPIQSYIDYIEKIKEAKPKNINSSEMVEIVNEISNFRKQKVLNFLKNINPSVTLENMDKLIEGGAFADIDRMIPVYKEIIEKYSKDIGKINDFILEDENNKKLKNNLQSKYWMQLLNEFSFLFNNEKVLEVKQELEKYGYVVLNNQKDIESYIGSSLFSTLLISSFSEESETILDEGKQWQKESIIRDRIKFFKNMGIDLGDNYEAYINNTECQKIIPPQNIVRRIESRKKELNDIMLSQYYKSTKEYQSHRARIDQHKLLNKDDSFNANSYFNKSTFVSPNIIIKDGEYSLLPLMCINMNIQEYLDVTTIHELNHVFELNLVGVNGPHCDFSCGWDILEGDIETYADDIENLDKREEKRKYELFNEIINEIIAQDITTILHNSGNYIFNTKDNAKIKGGTSYEHTFFLVRDFYQNYKKEILETRKTRDMQPLFDVIGKENFDALNNLFHVFYENFNGMKIYSVVQDLNNKKENEDTLKFKQLILDRDNILTSMNEYALKNKESQK